MQALPWLRQKTQVWQPLPISLRPPQNPKRKNCHQVHFTEKETEAQGAEAGLGLRGPSQHSSERSSARSPSSDRHA